MGVITHTGSLESTAGYATTNTVTWNRLARAAGVDGMKQPDNINVKPGDIIDITNMFTNTGDVFPAPTFRDVLDRKTQLVAGTVKVNGSDFPTYRYEGNVLTLENLDDLEAGGTLTISFQVEVLEP